MRYVSQFTGPSSTVQNTAPETRYSVPNSAFDDLVQKGPQTQYDKEFYRYTNALHQHRNTRWVITNRNNFSYRTARLAVRINPWMFAAATGVGIVAGLIKTANPETRWRIEGYNLVRDCGRGYTYTTASAGIPPSEAGCTSRWSVVNAAQNNVVGRPINIWAWEYDEPRSATTHWARASKHWERQDLTGKDPAWETLPGRGWAPDPFTAAGQPGGVPIITPIPYTQVPTGWSSDPGYNPYYDEITQSQPSTQTKPFPMEPLPGPPAPGEKEKKLRVRLPWLIATQGAAHFTTEGLEWLDCIWKSLPKSLRTKPTHKLVDFMPGGQVNNPLALVTLPSEKIIDVYKHFDQIDWVGKRDSSGSLINPKQPGAATCLALNGFIDLGIGLTQGLAQSEATKRRVILGLLG